MSVGGVGNPKIIMPEELNKDISDVLTKVATDEAEGNVKLGLRLVMAQADTSTKKGKLNGNELADFFSKSNTAKELLGSRYETVIKELKLFGKRDFVSQTDNQVGFLTEEKNLDADRAFVHEKIFDVAMRLDLISGNAKQLVGGVDSRYPDAQKDYNEIRRIYGLLDSKKNPQTGAYETDLTVLSQKDIESFYNLYEKYFDN